MKALTLYQPWAHLVAIGAKQIETRSWSTDYRGPLAIHASVNTRFIRGKESLIGDEPFHTELMKQWNGEHYPDFQLGVVVATCNLVNVVEIPPEGYLKIFVDPSCNSKEEIDPMKILYRMFYIPPGNPELAFGDYTPGRFAWILRDIKRLPNLVCVRGAMKLWEIPDEKLGL